MRDLVAVPGDHRIVSLGAIEKRQRYSRASAVTDVRVRLAKTDEI
jgi:hypothetical protein